MTTGGELFLVDRDFLDARRFHALRVEGAALRIGTTSGEVSVRLNRRRVVISLPSAGEIA